MEQRMTKTRTIETDFGLERGNHPRLRGECIGFTFRIHGRTIDIVDGAGRWRAAEGALTAAYFKVEDIK